MTTCNNIKQSNLSHVERFTKYILIGLIVVIATRYIPETILQTKEIIISWEHQDYKWLAYQEALELVTFKNGKELLKKANDFILENNL